MAARSACNTVMDERLGTDITNTQSDDFFLLNISVSDIRGTIGFSICWNYDIIREINLVDGDENR